MVFAFVFGPISHPNNITNVATTSITQMLGFDRPSRGTMVILRCLSERTVVLSRRGDGATWFSFLMLLIFSDTYVIIWVSSFLDGGVFGTRQATYLSFSSSTFLKIFLNPFEHTFGSQYYVRL